MDYLNLAHVNALAWCSNKSDESGRTPLSYAISQHNEKEIGRIIGKYKKWRNIKSNLPLDMQNNVNDFDDINKYAVDIALKSTDEDFDELLESKTITFDNSRISSFLSDCYYKQSLSVCRSRLYKIIDHSNMKNNLNTQYFGKNLINRYSEYEPEIIDEIQEKLGPIHLTPVMINSAQVPQNCDKHLERIKILDERLEQHYEDTYTLHDCDCPNVAKYMLEKPNIRANINKFNHKGRTALFQKTVENIIYKDTSSAECISVLKEHGGIIILDNENQTPEIVAKKEIDDQRREDNSCYYGGYGIGYGGSNSSGPSFCTFL
ncbi:hypothetical protein QLL95_gp0126 [Cotonvirus japonicus]|uniref:Ankyrin repeat protein n=1 Tax=Cotonvirus japonicus TaxID=2811091 RepID=A0ABM7NR31_9VIRU|nr:hypothetical protein QLL95_gp0126 [Cotonvirus japonicus]BCS82615.1 hypothetical protein [Cotonvirus japonicus]